MGVSFTFAKMTETLTKEQFRVEFYENLKSSGISDKLKSQLRARLITELKIKNLKLNNQTFLDVSKYNKTKGNLLFKVIDSLIIEYLKSRNLEFSLSVFLPETGFNQPHQV